MALKIHFFLLNLALCATLCWSFPKERPTEICLEVKSGDMPEKEKIRGYLDQCFKVLHETVSSTVKLIKTDDDDFAPEYLLVAYSSNECGDDESVVKNALLSTEDPVKLNERNPIRSFLLGKNPISPLKINFSYEDGHQKSINSNDKSCCEVCPNDKGACPYPVTLDIRETDEQVADNSARLFSKPGCEDESLISDPASKSSEVTDGADLVQHTQKDQIATAKSFLVRACPRNQ